MMKKKLLYIFLIGFIACCQSVFAQSGDIVRGKVTSDSGEELISATVLEVDRNGRTINHALTDMNGDFSLKIGSDQNQIKVSYIGFSTEVVPIGAKRTITIILKEDNRLTEVVIQAKRTASDGVMSIPEREVGFAMQKINTSTFEGLQVSSIDDALQGQIAGLDIVGSGDMGKGTSMRIRGVSSLNSNSNPLIVINNVPREDISSADFDFATANQDQFGDLLSINPDDIEEIQVLKDAASTAIWGSRGANGVLLITTKKGVKGPTRVNYTYKFSREVQPTGLKMLNGDDYSMMMKQAFFNPKQSSEDSNKPEFNYDRTFSEYQYYNNNTDWRDAVIQTGYTHDHYLVISGGGEKANFRVGAGYMTREGTIIGQSWDRITTRTDLDYYVSSRIKFSTEFSFSYSDNDRSWEDGRGDHNYINGKSILDIAYKKMPNLSIYNKDANGNVLDSYYSIRQDSKLDDTQKALRNPVAQAALATNNLKSYNIQPIFRLRYDLLNPEEQTLQYNVWVSFQMKNEKTKKFLPKEVSSKAWDHEDINRADDLDYESFETQTGNSILWAPKFSNDDHHLQLLGSVDTKSGSDNRQNIISFGFPNSEITDGSAEGHLYSAETKLGQWRSFGMVARAHYAYKSKYILGLTFRREGSTKFGKDNKYGNFPSVSLRWNLSDESFMDSTNDWLSMLAIRPSWGISGNQPAHEYMHFSKYVPKGSYGGKPAIQPDNIRLSNLKWESKEEYNLGADLGILNDTYTLEANYYHSKTKDMLFADQAIPTSTGYDKLLYRNGGTMQNDGWELNFNANRFLQVGDFSFDLRFNIANSVNKLLTLNEDIMNSYNKAFENKNGQYLYRVQEGKAFGSIYGFRYKGVYQYSPETYMESHQNDPNATAPIARNANGEIIYDSKGDPLPMYFNYATNGKNYQFQAGDAIYEDINHDGNIDELDIVYLGNSNPKLTGGFGFNIRWKQLSLSAQTNFRYGNKIINTARMEAENMHTTNNQSIAVNWRWRKEGDITEMPRALYDYGYNWLGSDRFIEDGSFLRLKYVTLRYNVPSAAIKQYGLRQLNFYVTVNNLFTLTKYEGVDPEIGWDRWGVSEDKSTTPRTKDFTVGVTVGF